LPAERDGHREGDLDGRERQREIRRESRDVEAGRLRDEDEEYTTRKRRQGWTREKVRKANATKRDGEARFQSERVRETTPSTPRRGWTRGARTHRLKNLDLYLDLRKERVVRHAAGWEGWGGERRGGGGPGLEGEDGLAEMANAYGSSPEVRECKFYDQSDGLIRCAAACLTARKRKRRPFAEIFGSAKHR
jgi:hypothetical protein